MKKAIPVIVLIAGLGVLYPMQKWIDTNLPREVIDAETLMPPEAVDADTLYLTSGDTIRRMSLGMRGLAANIYWIRTIQYFGDKLMRNSMSKSTRAIPMKSLEPLLNIVVQLDPQQIQACRFGAIFLSERNFDAAVKLLEYGFQENPDQWRLCQDLGFIYWQAGNYEKAAEWYERGAAIPGAREFMSNMAGLMKVRGGRREEARAIYLRYYESDNPAIKKHAYERLKQIQALDEMDAINRILGQYHAQTGSCPASLRQLAQKWRAMGLTLNNELIPIDPDGFPYAYDPTKCKVDLNPETTLPL